VTSRVAQSRDVETFMKKTKTRKILIYSAIMGGVFFMQGCGSGSDSSTQAAAIVNNPPADCAYNAEGQYVCNSGGVAGQSLYSACGSANAAYAAEIALQGTEPGNITVSSATPATSPDGTPVCQITFSGTEEYYSPSQRYFLGTNCASNPEPGNSGISLANWDQFAILGSGSYGGSGCSNTVTNSGTQLTGANGTNSGDLYGELTSGFSDFPIYGQVQTVSGAGAGYLYFGVNQGVGQGGCMEVQLTYQIERCVDGNGVSHECPTPMPALN
jgi:hypothetical protein